MKNEPAFKSLQGNPAFFQFKASQCPFQLGQKTRVPLTYILLREFSSCGACGKLPFLLIRRQGISSNIDMNWGTRALLVLLFSTWCSSRLGTVFSGNLWSGLKEVKPLVLFDEQCRMALDPVQGNQASSRVDLGYTELFCVAAITSGSH